MRGLEDVEADIPKKLLTADQKKAKNVIKKVEDKYAAKKQMLVMGYERAVTEERVHGKQKNYRKYERMYEQYAYPINLLKFEEKDRAPFLAHADEQEQALTKL